MDFNTAYKKVVSNMLITPNPKAVNALGIGMAPVTPMVCVENVEVVKVSPVYTMLSAERKRFVLDEIVAWCKEEYEHLN